ncbi:hypothetical protein C7974DRAFT_171021 [Boeremia exigua]|uniref:uncharacterized protein n=1 Tax=Boeremia exigua TaxID=749465 RepID=UPI001E8DDC35|nr:uncharacterized protein C7974DRAFT_171021 [Boeremia exigua]KAH6633421.1 hypothetical protein C7974DRAFT_171021 [Boeremia exigua]
MMQLIYNTLTLTTLAFALPSQEQRELIHTREIGANGALMAAAQCDIGQHYCFGAIIDDLKVAKQDILHQYCDQKYKNDWQSCNTCKRPWAMPDCWDGQGAWLSVFECTGPETYKWVGRCEGEGSICSGGTCRKTEVDAAGRLALIESFSPSGL